MLFQINLFAFLTMLGFVAAGNVLTEKPSFLHPCKISESSLHSCLTKNYQVIFNEWKDGVTGLKSVGSIDPLTVRRVSIASDPKTPIQFNVDMENFVMTGLAGATIRDMHFDPKKLIVKFKVFSPKMHVNTDYAMKGHIINLVIDGKGKALASMEKVLTHIIIRMKKREESGYTFCDIDKLRFEVEEVGSASMHLDNLFNGDKALEDSANTLINQNWQTMYEVGRPGINKAIETILKDRLTKIFGYVPCTYIFEDLFV